jgi:hypothetical protein
MNKFVDIAFGSFLMGVGILFLVAASTVIIYSTHCSIAANKLDRNSVCYDQEFVIRDTCITDRNAPMCSTYNFNIRGK